MRTRCVTILLLFIFAAALPAQAEFWIGSVADGYGNKASNVMNFDWSSSGSGVAKGVGPAGTPLVAGENFEFLYQSYLFALNAPNGQVVPFPGLNTAFEYTVVASIPEMVASVTPIDATMATAFFKTLGGYFYIYYDGTPDAKVATGQGFANGDLVAWGTIEPDQFSGFTFNSATMQGIGSFVLTGTVAGVDPDYLDPALKIVEFRIEGTINYPPIDSTTTGFFDGSTVAADDLLLKVDASHKFTISEEVLGDCRVTAGGVKDGITVPCLLKANGLPDPKTCATAEMDTWGGQAGAQPGIDGNWTHHHVVNSRQSFVFHSNELFWIGCSDPGCCVPACANAKNRQINFSGIGSFNNQKGYTPALPSGELCFMVHLEDIGEPGPGGRWPSATSPCTHCPGTPIEDGDCVNCTDYYEIKIYDTAARDNAGQCTGTLVYYNGPGDPANCAIGDPSLFGYFTRSGNVQMHPPNN